MFQVLENTFDDKEKRQLSEFFMKQEQFITQGPQFYI